MARRLLADAKSVECGLTHSWGRWPGRTASHREIPEAPGHCSYLDFIPGRLSAMGRNRLFRAEPLPGARQSGVSRRPTGQNPCAETLVHEQLGEDRHLERQDEPHFHFMTVRLDFRLEKWPSGFMSVISISLRFPHRQLDVRWLLLDQHRRVIQVPLLCRLCVLNPLLFGCRHPALPGTTAHGRKYFLTSLHNSR